jgi:hypothetical protein
MYRHQVMADKACEINDLDDALHFDRHPGDRRSRVPWARRRRVSRRNDGFYIPEQEVGKPGEVERRNDLFARAAAACEW